MAPFFKCYKLCFSHNMDQLPKALAFSKDQGLTTSLSNQTLMAPFVAYTYALEARMSAMMVSWE